MNEFEKLQQKVSALNSFYDQAYQLQLLETKNSNTKKELAAITTKIVEIIGTGYWAPALLLKGKKCDLSRNICHVCARLVREYQQRIEAIRDKQEETAKNEAKLFVVNRINSKEHYTPLIAVGEYSKGCRHVVYFVDGKYYVLLEDEGCSLDSSSLVVCTVPEQGIEQYGEPTPAAYFLRTMQQNYK